MKQYVRYTCTTCFRSVDRLVQSKHASIDKCSITHKCTGRMAVVGYLNNAMILPSVTSGLENWRPRWSQNVQVKSAPVELIDTSTSDLGTMTLAIRLPITASDTAPITVTFVQQDEKPKDYKQFMFRFDAGFQLVAGTESGLEKKALRYSASDDVAVYLNGVIQEEGTEPTMYQRYNEVNGVPQNTIKFNSAIENNLAITQVDVIISKPRPSSEVNIRFSKNFLAESDTSNGSWKNVKSVSLVEDDQTVSYLLYHFDVVTDASTEAPVLKKDSVLVPSKITMNGTELSVSRAFFVFANAPYLHIDRTYTSIARFSDLDQERDYLKFSVVDGKPKMYITDSAVSDVFPPMVAETFVRDPVIQRTSQGVKQVIINSTKVIGPSV